jgi:hypothetical protein
MNRLQSVFLFILISIMAFGFLRSPGTVDVHTFMEWTRKVEAMGIIGGYHANQADLSTSLFRDPFIIPGCRAVRLDTFICLNSLLTSLLLSTISGGDAKRLLAVLFELAWRQQHGLGYTDI